MSDGNFAYDYDDEGSRIYKEDLTTHDYMTYEWDYRNRLVAVNFFDSGDDLQSRVEYSYDVFNHWIGKQVDTDGDEVFDASEAFVYDGTQIALRFADDTDAPLGASSLTNRYLWGPVVDQILADEYVTAPNAAGTVLWPLTDHLGTVRDMASFDPTANSGAGGTMIANHIVYDSFGNVISETHDDVDSFFGFTGRPYDSDTGLQDNGNRKYDAPTGQWVSQDPIGFTAQDSNLFRYVGNAPQQFLDSTGLDRYITRFGTNWMSVHVGVAVDIWAKQEDGTWMAIGQKTFDHSTDPTALCYLNSFVSIIAGYGRVTPSNGLNLAEGYITIPSTPQEDMAMLAYLEDQVKNPSFYGVFVHQCVFWSVNAVNVGIDPTKPRPQKGEEKIPAWDPKQVFGGPPPK